MASELLALIESDPLVLLRQARVAGTRVTVSVVLDCLVAGMSAAEILAEYPSLSATGIRASAAYGAMRAGLDQRPPNVLEAASGQQFDLIGMGPRRASS